MASVTRADPPREVRRPQELAAALAVHASELRRAAATQLAAEAERGTGRLLALREEFAAALVRLDDAAFVDAYAQTLTVGLLAARWLSRAEGEGFTREAVPRLLPSTRLAGLFGRLVGSRRDFAEAVDERVEEVVGLLARTDVRAVFAGADGDPSIHFYEAFLDAYDPRLRRDRGVYYTPDEVVGYMVETAHAALQARFGLRLGLADTTTWAELARRTGIAVPDGVDGSQAFVQILDPSTGTGTFLVRTIAEIHATMLREYAALGWDEPRRLAAWREYVREHLLPRLFGFEVMPAPFMLCHLRVALALARTGAVFAGDERVRVFLGDTLQAAGAPGPETWARRDAPISVVLGNPPYERETDGARKGGWIVGGVDGGRAPLADYAEPARDAAAGGHLKNIYNLYVYFWRWAGWRVFDRHGGPGVVSLVTASSFVRGPGFAGMREEMRRSADEIFVLDLEGDHRGAVITENVFLIMSPVCVATLIRARVDRSTPARVHYRRVTGGRAEKLAACRGWRTLAEVPWEPGPSEWQAPLMAGGSAAYAAWPAVTDVFPWQHSGAQFKRTWPISPEAAVLRARWSALMLAEPARRAALFRETGAWKVSGIFNNLFGGGEQAALVGLPGSAPAPRICRYGFRSFDRQYAFADERVGDRLRPPLWRVAGPSQVYMTSLLTGALGPGPAATVSADVPDLHHFSGRGGKDVIPLWRDAAGTVANVAAGVTEALSRAYGRRVRGEEVFAYVYAVLADPGYVQRFAEALRMPGPRVPISRSAALFERGAALGRELLRWHTYGERFRETDDGFELAGSAAVVAEIPEACPERWRYDAAGQVLHVGAGRVGPVAPAVFGFSVSGLPVVKSWLDYRMKKGAGRRSSPLDELRAERWTAEATRGLLELLWVLEWTVGRHAALGAWLDEVLAGELVLAAEVGPSAADERREPRFARGRG